MNVDQIEFAAKMAYELNAAYCRALGDFSFLPWEDAPDWQKGTVIDGVMFHLENPEASPSESHENWLKKKEADGWVYGEIKDPEMKQHPCIMPFVALSTEQQAKDFLIITVVRCLSE